MVIDCHAHYSMADADFPEWLVELLPQAGIDKICLFPAGEAFGHAPNETVLAAALWDTLASVTPLAREA